MKEIWDAYVIWPFDKKLISLSQRVPALRTFWDFSKSPTSMKIPHLYVHKPKTMVVETMLVIFA